jgi:endonuclease-3
MARKTISLPAGAKRHAAQTARRAAVKQRREMGPTAHVKRHAAQVVRHLRADYPEATCALVHRSPFELLVATILSAQCTDARVNQVTRELFAKYPTPERLAALPQEELEREIQSTGFFRNKAKSIRACCRALVERYGGEVPREMEALVELPGIGRKTANVVLGTAYGLATGVVVDTHVGRISRRLGLSAEKDPEKVERDLMQLMPQSEWVDFSHRMIHHGRGICVARQPRCERCSMNKICPKIGVDRKG